MGFGWLFIGYFATYFIAFSRLSYGFMLIGCLFMWRGLSKLGNFNPAFGRARIPLLATMAVKLYMCLSLLNEFAALGLSMFASPVSTVFEVSEYIADAAFNIMLLLAIKSITSDLKLVKQYNASVRNMTIISIYYAFALLWMIPFKIPDDVNSGIVLFLLISRLLWSVLDLILLYSCYMYICPAGDEDMPLKKSRFEFINRFREATARRQQKALDENVEAFRRHKEDAAKRLARKKKKK